MHQIANFGYVVEMARGYNVAIITRIDVFSINLFLIMHNSLSVNYYFLAINGSKERLKGILRLNHFGSYQLV